MNKQDLYDKERSRADTLIAIREMEPELRDELKFWKDFYSFDWYYEMSDSLQVWRAGRESEAKLWKEVAKRFDGDDDPELISLKDMAPADRSKWVRENYPNIHMAHWDTEDPGGLIGYILNGLTKEQYDVLVRYATVLLSIGMNRSMRQCDGAILKTVHAPDREVLRSFAKEYRVFDYYGYCPNNYVQDQLNGLVEDYHQYFGDNECTFDPLAILADNGLKADELIDVLVRDAYYEVPDNNKKDLKLVYGDWTNAKIRFSCIEINDSELETIKTSYSDSDNTPYETILGEETEDKTLGKVVSVELTYTNLDDDGCERRHFIKYKFFI